MSQQKHQEITKWLNESQSWKWFDKARRPTDKLKYKGWWYKTKANVPGEQSDNLNVFNVLMKNTIVDNIICTFVATVTGGQLGKMDTHVKKKMPKPNI